VPGERLTIDLNVAWDYLDLARPGGAAALVLFELARRGEVELVLAPQGHRLDADGDLAAELEHLVGSGEVGEAQQLSYPSAVTYPGEDFYPGHVVDGFAAAWSQVVADWRSHERTAPGDTDRWYIETHLADGREVFLTGDQALLVMCRRLREEHGFPIVALTTSEYLAKRTSS
jgi:hypothetical protein